MKIPPNSAVLNARANELAGALSDKDVGRTLKAARKDEIKEDIAERHDQLVTKAEETFDAADTMNVFARVGAAVGATLAAVGTYGMACAMVVNPGLGAAISVALSCAGAAAITGLLFCTVSRGIGGLVTVGSEDAAGEAGQLAGELDLERKSDIHMSKRTGDANIERGRDTQRNVEDQIGELLNNEAR